MVYGYASGIVGYDKKRRPRLCNAPLESNVTTIVATEISLAKALAGIINTSINPLKSHTGTQTN